MKFLCLRCNDAMSLRETERPESGDSISAVFGCPTCGTEIAMLTNAYETQVVDSLGVKIGPDGGSSAGKCPFATASTNTGAEATAGTTTGAGPEPEGLPWTAGALARLDNVPEMVRPMARQGVEYFARSQGCPMVTEDVMERARGQFGT